MSGLIDLSPGAIFADQFRVVRPLAKGGMGAVYVVEQMGTGRERALKLMHPMLVSDERSLERFEREARVGSVIESDHVVEVIAAGVDRNSSTPWLCMELLRGETLGDRIEKGGPLGQGEAIEVAKQLGHALAAAHAAGIVHRDLKPENVFLGVSRREGVPFTLKVLDFGVAAFVKEAQSAKTTQGVGSPMWMAPEQTDVGKVTRATDIWALGLIAYFVLTGRLYWASPSRPGASLTALLVEIMVEPLDAPSVRAADVAHRLPPGFDGWFGRCVARDPLQRFQQVEPAIAELVAMISGAPASLSIPPTRVVPHGFEETVAATGPLVAPMAKPIGSAPPLEATARTPKRRTGLYVLGGLGLALAAGCGLVTWNVIAGARALGEQISSASPQLRVHGDHGETVVVGSSGIVITGVDDAEDDAEDEATDAIGDEQTADAEGEETEAEDDEDEETAEGEESEADDEESEEDGEAEATAAPVRTARAEASPPRARRAPRLSAHGRAFVNDVVTACWRGNPGEPGPTRVRASFELMMGPAGTIRNMRITGFEGHPNFRRCCVVRGTEYRFATPPEGSTVELATTLGD